MSEKIKYWWSEDRQWFCIRIKGETASLTVAEAEELMGEVQQTPSFLALQEEAAQRAVELMEQSRAIAGSERIDIVERLRFDATRCELQFSKGVAGNINDAAAEIERLRGLVPTPAQSVQVPAGWRLVPVDPTQEMVRHAYAVQPGAINAGFAQAYRDMLEAAPYAAQPPAAPVDGEKAAKDYEYGYNDGIEWAQTHGRSSAAAPVEVDPASTFTDKEWHDALMGDPHPRSSAGNAALVAEADGVLSVGNAMDMSISGAWAFIKKARDALAAIEPQQVEVTDEMINAGAAALFGDGWAKNATPANRRYCREKARDIFAAMSLLLLSRPIPQQAPVTAQGHLQSRGRHYDIIKEAIAAYDEYMLDDDYDAQGTLNQIIKKMRERVELSDAPSPSLSRPHGGGK